MDAGGEIDSTGAAAGLRFLLTPHGSPTEGQDGLWRGMQFLDGPARRSGRCHAFGQDFGHVNGRASVSIIILPQPTHRRWPVLRRQRNRTQLFAHAPIYAIPAKSPAAKAQMEAMNLSWVSASCLVAVDSPAEPRRQTRFAPAAPTPQPRRPAHYSWSVNPCLSQEGSRPRSRIICRSLSTGWLRVVR